MAVVTVVVGLALAAGAAPAKAVTIKEFSPPGLHPYLYNIATGADGNLWFVATSEARIDRMTPEGVLTEFPLPHGSSPAGITAGPDGDLWFTEEIGTGRIGRITPGGVVTEFSAGISDEAGGITVGPEGNLWFAERDGKIGRITPKGVVTEFSGSAKCGFNGNGIALGPDNNLWFTDYCGAVVARITPAGVVTEFSSGITAGSEPYSVAAGPDGNLWFTEMSGRIGRITPQGVVTEFSTGISPGSGPWEISAAPDGNLWFTERTGNRVGRITPKGVVTEFSEGITPEGRPAGITTGPDGNIWFTEEAGRIGRVALEPTVTKLSPAKGPVTGGTAVTITGTNLSGATAVKFGSSDATSVAVKSATKITAISPAESAGTVDVTVTTPGGTSGISTKDRFKFVPSVTAISPNTGSKAGGTSVTVTGSGFALGSTATVFKFDSTKATSVECTSSTTCTVIAPAHAVGTVDVKATVNKASSAKNAPADQFTYS